MPVDASVAVILRPMCPPETRKTGRYHRGMNALDLTLLYLAAAVLGVVGCRLLKLPPMLGYLVVGVVIGPNALALAQNSQGLRYLAEFGVVFLMFVIGLEFSLPKLKAMKRHVFGLGLSQVVLTVTLTTLGSLALGRLLHAWWKMEWQTALSWRWCRCWC